MSRDIVMGQSLSEDDVKYLKERFPLETVNRYLELAGQVEEEGSDEVADVEDVASLGIGDLDEEGLREASSKVGEVVDALLERADELGIELEEFPVATVEDVVEDDDDKQGDAGSTPEEKLFDPNDHKVDKVQEYLMTASAEEIVRVKDLEAKGQKRKTVLEA